MLSTANGEILADEGFDLHIESLGIDILAYVLDSTPNLLALGRLIVDNGFDIHWLGLTLEPWLVHPITREEIPMAVEDYTPFLDNLVSNVMLWFVDIPCLNFQ